MTGVGAALFFTGTSLSVTAIIGVVLLVGVVVNNYLTRWGRRHQMHLTRWGRRCASVTRCTKGTPQPHPTPTKGGAAPHNKVPIFKTSAYFPNCHDFPNT
jgi:hypothetical protein